MKTLIIIIKNMKITNGEHSDKLSMSVLATDRVNGLFTPLLIINLYLG